jgi:hypothetical protein
LFSYAAFRSKRKTSGLKIELLLRILFALSCFNSLSKIGLKAMEKAKEAYRKERLILKQREEKNLAEQANTELTGFVRVNSIYFTFGLKFYPFIYRYEIKFLLNVKWQ